MAKKRGHYCKVCGEYKSNESFSGRGHAAHICKKCAALPAAQRSEEMVLTKLWNLPWQLSTQQLKWLKGLVTGGMGNAPSSKRRGLVRVSACCLLAPKDLACQSLMCSRYTSCVFIKNLQVCMQTWLAMPIGCEI